MFYTVEEKKKLRITMNVNWSWFWPSTLQMIRAVKESRDFHPHLG